MRITCGKCGNQSGWRNAQMSGGQYSATCGKCGNQVTGSGGIEMGTVQGDMTQTTRRNKPRRND